MMTSVTGVASTDGTQYQNVMTQGSKTLGQDAFLSLLVTELRNQDPLQPTDDKEFIAQLAQFSSLEQTQNMSQSLAGFVKTQPMLQAANLIGRTVNAVGADGTSLISGKVESVSQDSSGLLLKIGGSEVPLENVTAMS